MDLDRNQNEDREAAGAESHLEPVHARAKPNAMDFSDWAARPAPRRSVANPAREGLDIGALKIFLILAGLTAGMALALRSLF